MFQTIQQMFQQGNFCDLKISVRGDTQDVVLCHSLVIAAAVPELLPCLTDAARTMCDEYVSVVVDSVAVGGSSVRQSVENIYEALAGEAEACRLSWTDVFVGKTEVATSGMAAATDCAMEILEGVGLAVTVTSPKANVKRDAAATEGEVCYRTEIVL